MTTSSDEQLSALLDGELQGSEERRAVDRVCDADPETRAQLGRFRLIGDLMRGESQLLGDGIHEGIRAAISGEPTVLAPRPPRSRWARPLAGVAVAASVAAAAVVIAPQFLGQPLGLTGETTVAASSPPNVVAPTVAPIRLASDAAAPTTATVTPRWQTLDPALSERLNRLVIEHHEFGGRTGVNGPVAHIGLVNYAGR